jgi:hypothetical protein
MYLWALVRAMGTMLSLAVLHALYPYSDTEILFLPASAGAVSEATIHVFT